MMRNTFVAIALTAALASVASPAKAVLLNFDTETATTIPSMTPNSPTRPGALTSISGVVDGITVTISRSGGQSFDIIDNAQQGNLKAPNELNNGKWGARSIDPFINTTKSLIISFDTAVHTVSMLIGDFGADTDAVQLKAYSNANATGLIKTTTTDLPTSPTVPGSNKFTEKRVSVFSSAVNIRSVELIAGAGVNNDLLSVFIDRLFFSATPEVVDATHIPDIPISTTEVSFMLNFLGVDNPLNLGDQFFVAGDTVPEPTGLAMLGLGAVAMMRRRRRA